MMTLNEEIETKVIESLRNVPVPSAKITRDLLNKFIRTVAALSGMEKDSNYWNFKEKISETSSLLGIDKTLLIKAALENHQIFYQSPQTLNQNIRSAAELFDVPLDRMIKAALRRPSIFSRLPETLFSNIQTLADLTGLDFEDLIDSAMDQPNLMTQCPQTLNDNIEKLSKILKVTKSQVLQAALIHPPLFYRSPETIGQNVRAIQAARRAGFIDSSDVVCDLLKRPLLLGLSRKNTELRMAYYEAVGKRGYTTLSFFKKSKKATENAIVDHYRKLGRNGVQEIKRLFNEGLISNSFSKIKRDVPTHTSPVL